MPPYFAVRPDAAVVVLVAVCLVVLVSIVAFAIDGGMLMDERRHAQAVADGAALSAACDLFDNYWTNSGTDPNGTAVASALATAAANGYNNDGIQSIVTVNIPPKSGDYAAPQYTGYAEVLVQFNQPDGLAVLFCCVGGSSGFYSGKLAQAAPGQRCPQSHVGILKPQMLVGVAIGKV